MTLVMLLLLLLAAAIYLLLFLAAGSLYQELLVELQLFLRRVVATPHSVSSTNLYHFDLPNNKL
jgi:hypothetical protein